MADDHSARDYATISPAALSLLLLKARAQIPFAAEASAILWPDSPPDSLIGSLSADEAERRLEHFAARYRSLDELLRESALSRVLEIGAGLSFRSLELTRTTDLFYLDTDLPNLVALKRDLVAKLQPMLLKGTLRIQPLDALDADAFDAAVSAIPSGELAIANEGLLMYLDGDEKARLAANVRKALLARGGVWLTADVYVRSPSPEQSPFTSSAAREFLERHRVEENKFQSFEAAALFFRENGFEISKRLAEARGGRVRESWMLRVAN